RGRPRPRGRRTALGRRRGRGSPPRRRAPLPHRARVADAPGARRSRPRLELDRRRPRPLFVEREAVVVEGRAIVAVARVCAHAVALGVALAAQSTRVHRGRGLLDRAYVVRGRPPGHREVRILELDRTTGVVHGTVELPPRILDQLADGLSRPHLRAHAHHFDPGDQAPLVARVVALVVAEEIETIVTEYLTGILRAARLLLEAPDGTHAEVRRHRQRGPSSHRHGAAVGTVQEVEPQEDALAARAIDLPTLERIPDGVAVAAGAVDRHQTTRHEEGARTLHVHHLERLARGDLIDRARLRGRRVEPPEQPFTPDRALRTDRLRHRPPRVFLVHGAAASG